MKLFGIILATIVGLVSSADASTHPNQKKIAKWEGKIVKYTKKIANETAKASIVMVPAAAYTYAAPAQMTSIAPPVDPPAVSYPVVVHPVIQPTVVYHAPMAVIYHAPTAVVVRPRVVVRRPLLSVICP